jgi:hypothetical protein
MSLRPILPLVAALSLALPLHAQDSTLSPGTRVRILSACDTTGVRTGCDVVKGQLLSRTVSELLIKDADGVERRVHLAPGLRIQQSTGYRRHTLRGLGIGTLAGLATGGILVADCTRGGRGEDNGLCSVRLVVSTAAGAGLGALIGALSRSERWETVAESRASLHVRPMNGCTAVALAFSF